MKRIKLTVLMMAVVGLFVTSCGKDDDPVIDQSPNLSFKGGSEYVSANATVKVGVPFKIGVTASSNTDSKSKLVSVKYTVTSNNEIISQKDSVFKAASFDLDYNFNFTNAGAAVIRYTVTDKKGETASKQLVITIKPETTDLPAAVPFAWARIGGAAGTGLDVFGLSWTSNAKVTSAQIKKSGATKMVKLTAAEWTSITTAEALSTAIANGTDMDTFNDVSVEASSTYDIVLGVENAGIFYMIHVTKADVTTGAAGTTVSITGNFKASATAAL